MKVLNPGQWEGGWKSGYDAEREGVKKQHE
jgi:hypothetical protein